MEGFAAALGRPTAEGHRCVAWSSPEASTGKTQKFALREEEWVGQMSRFKG